MAGTSPTTAHNGVIPQPVQVCYPSSPRDRFLYFSFIIALHASHFRQRAIFLGGFLLLFFFFSYLICVNRREKQLGVCPGCVG